MGTVNRSCEKLGCNEPAEVAFGIDRAACVVWLETYDADEARHLNRLCGDHASRLTLPRGWSFDDRREKSPRLFVAPRLTEVKAKPAAKPARQSSNKSATTASRTSSNNTSSVPRRTSRDTSASGRSARDTSATGHTSRDVSAPVKRFDGLGLFDPTLPMGSPKLDPSLTRDTTQAVNSTVSDSTVSDSAFDASTSTDEQSTDSQYAPKFDRTSDVGGALKASGRLLSRAFSSQTKPIERPVAPDPTTGQRRTSDTDSLPQGDHIDDFHQGDHVE